MITVLYNTSHRLVDTYQMFWGKLLRPQMMKIVGSSGTIVPTYQFKSLHHILKDHNLDTHHYESLRVRTGKGKHVFFLTVTP